MPPMCGYFFIIYGGGVLEILEKQAAVHKKEMDKEKSSRKKERIGWIVGTAVGGYLLTL